MKDVYLRNLGKSLVPVNREGEEALASYPINSAVRVKITQDRLLSHHRFLFAFIREVFEAWPNTHKIQPPDEDWLRAWLLVRADVRHTMTVAWDILGTKEPFAAVAILKRVAGTLTDRPVWFAIDPDQGIIEMSWAKSIAFHKMDQQEFSETTTRIYDVVYEETGIDVDDVAARWQKEHGKLKVEPKRTVRGNGSSQRSESA